MENGSSLFDELRGCQLSAVTFVQDYLQLWFDGPGINVTNPLTIESDGRKIKSWNVGFRDLLCGQIGKKVENVTCKRGESFVMEFVDGSELTVSLNPDDYRSAEAIYAHDFKGHAWTVI
jgi:hypothetical protein